MNLIRLELLFLSAIFTFMPNAFAADSQKQIDVAPLDNLYNAVKNMMDGPSAKVPLVIDGIILTVGAYASASMRTPAPIIGGAVSCVLFHALIKVFF